MAKSKGERTRETAGQPKGRSKVEAGSEVVELELRPELLKRAMAAATACGQTPSEWIREALTEAIERKSKVKKPKIRKQ